MGEDNFDIKGDTQTEYIKPSVSSEKKAPEKTSRQKALDALNKSDPQDFSREDLFNLANNITPQTESGPGSPDIDNELSKVKSTVHSEAWKKFEEAHKDIDWENDTLIVGAFKAEHGGRMPTRDEYLSIVATFGGYKRAEEEAYDAWTENNPDKAAVYANYNGEIQAALERKEQYERRPNETDDSNVTISSGTNIGTTEASSIIQAKPEEDQDTNPPNTEPKDTELVETEPTEADAEAVTEAAEPEHEAEEKKIYPEPYNDPAVRRVQTESASEASREQEVKEALRTNDPRYGDLWHLYQYAHSQRGWYKFVQEFPEKAAAYASKDKDIREALERYERVEQAEASNVEIELIDSESAGLQLSLLFDGEVPKDVDKSQVTEKANDKNLKVEKINKVSIGERIEYWQGKESPYKDNTHEQNLEIWEEQMKTFFNQYKGKPEAEFFSRFGIDLNNENAVKKLYKTYFVDGKGDVGLFASTIANSNTSEQIEENGDVILKLGKMYGENSAKVAEQLVAGIKNVQTDTDLFIRSAQDELKKGPEMTGIDLINLLNQNSGQIDNRSPVKDHEPQEVNEPLTESAAQEDNPDSYAETAGSQTKENEAPSIKKGDGPSSENKEPKYGERAKTADKVLFDFSVITDRWHSDGVISLDGDNISYVPSHDEGHQRTFYIPDYENEDLTEFVIQDEMSRPKRGFELAIDPSTDTTVDVTQFPDIKRVPNPVLWQILETDINSANVFTLSTSTITENTLRAKSYPLDFEEKIKGNGYQRLDIPSKELDVMVQRGGLTVDKKTMSILQGKAVEYLEGQVNQGQMPKEMLDAAKTLLEESRNAPNIVWDINKKQDIDAGSTAQKPKLHYTFLQFGETWKKGGRIRQEDDLLIYDDKKYQRKQEQREVVIGANDPNNPDKKLLTKQAWQLLKLVPRNLNGYTVSSGDLIDAVSNPIRDRQGTWKRFIKPFNTDGETLARMQNSIRAYVEKQVQEGRMDRKMLNTIDVLIKYKHNTLEPLGSHDKQVTYMIKRKRGLAHAEMKREPSLVEKVAEVANSTEPISNVDVTDSDISRYLGEKNLPFGARIKNLAIDFKGDTATMVGIVSVPIFGRVNFNLELANNPDGSGLVVTRYHVDTKSGTLRSKLGDLETSLRNINSFISGDINEQLSYRNPALRVLGLSISPDGKFLARVQNSQQAVA